jgi:phage terminase small subunit
MAPRGVKPKSAHLRLVDGTHRATRHGDEAKAKKVVADAVMHFGKPTCPKFLKGEALAAWKKWVAPAFWLDASKEAAAIAFCELWGEFRFAPTSFPASKHGQMRAYMSELGLTDERNRIHDSKNEHEDKTDDGFA